MELTEYEKALGGSCFHVLARLGADHKSGAEIQEYWNGMSVDEYRAEVVIRMQMMVSGLYCLAKATGIEIEPLIEDALETSREIISSEDMNGKYVDSLRMARGDFDVSDIVGDFPEGDPED